MLESFRSFFGYLKSGPRAYEQKILDQVKSELDPEARLLFAKQIDSVNLVQRHSNDKEVNFYCLKRGKVDIRDDFRFRNRAKEVKFARVVIKSHTTDETLRADLWAVDGCFFSLTFNRAPKDELEKEDFEVLACDLLVNVMEDRGKNVAVSNIKQLESGRLLSQLAEHGSLKNAIGPACGEDLRRFEELWGNKTPSDYLALLYETNGFVFNDWVFLGINVRYVVLPKQNIVVLAESPTRGALGAVEDDPNRTVVFCDYENQTIKPIGSSFLEALSGHDCWTA